MADWLSNGDRKPTAFEILGVGLGLVLIGAAAYGAFVLDGGFYSDDWANAANYRFADPPRYWSSVSELEGLIGGRPLMALLLPLPHALFGLDQSLHHGLALALGVLTSLCLYGLLRTLSLPPLHAGPVAALALLFPWSDSIRLWPTAGMNTIAVCLFLLGLTVALNGLTRSGRAALAWHGTADLLYLLSVLTYEATAAAALLAGALYLGRASIGAVARRWTADVIVVLGALVYSLETTVSARHVGTIGERLGDLGRFVRESLLLLASAVLPAGSLGRPVQALVLLAMAAVVGLAMLRLRRRDDPALRRWLRWIAVGAAGVVAAYFMFLGSHLHPLDPGIDTRVNVFAGLAYCVLVYAIVAAAARLAFGSKPLATGATLAAVAAIGVGYGVKLAGDESAWREAADRQRQVLAAIAHTLPQMAPGSTLLTFGFPAQAAPEVPIFDRSFDLSGALRLQAGESRLSAFPIYEGVLVRCGRRLVVDGGGGYGRFTIAYGPVFFLDAGGDAMRIESRAGCAGALRRLRPGPLEV